MTTTKNGYEINLTHETLDINGIQIPLNSKCEGLPEYERSNRREELLLAIAAVCAEEYGLELALPVLKRRGFLAEQTEVAAIDD